MTLTEYAKAYEPIPALAARVGVHRTTLYDIAKGRRRASAKMRKLLWRATDGKVDVHPLGPEQLDGASDET